MLMASIYAKEMHVITQVVGKWRHTNHHSIKNMLSQTIHTLEQQKFPYKLLGLNYTIKYRTWKENRAVATLSRQIGGDGISIKEGSLLSLSYTIN